MNSDKYEKMKNMVYDQIVDFEHKASELDRLKAETPKKEIFATDHRRLEIKAGVYRACAHDLENSLNMLGDSA